MKQIGFYRTSPFNTGRLEIVYEDMTGGRFIVSSRDGLIVTNYTEVKNFEPGRLIIEGTDTHSPPSIGDRVIHAYEYGDRKIAVGTSEIFRSSLRTFLREGDTENIPFTAFEIAKYLGQNAEIRLYANRCFKTLQKYNHGTATAWLRGSDLSDEMKEAIFAKLHSDPIVTEPFSIPISIAGPSFIADVLTNFGKLGGLNSRAGVIRECIEFWHNKPSEGSVLEALGAIPKMLKPLAERASQIEEEAKLYFPKEQSYLYRYVLWSQSFFWEKKQTTYSKEYNNEYLRMARRNYSNSVFRFQLHDLDDVAIGGWSNFMFESKKTSQHLMMALIYCHCQFPEIIDRAYSPAIARAIRSLETIADNHKDQVRSL